MDSNQINPFCQEQYDEKYLNLSLKKELPLSERNFWSWVYKNPESVKTPEFHSSTINSLALRSMIQTHETKKEKTRLKSELEKIFLSFSERRRMEDKIADYIESNIAKNGEIRIQRKNKTSFDNPFLIVDKLRSCRKSGVIGINGNNRFVFAYDSKCGLSKLCPDESRLESFRLFTKYGKSIERFISKANNTIQYAVFTKKNYRAEELGKGKKEILSEFRQLIRRDCFENVKGCLVIQEDPLTRKKEWNIHLNAMLLVKGHLDWKSIRESWGGNIEFISEKEMIKKSNKKKSSGYGTENIKSKLLLNSFKELCKYSTSSLTEKSQKGGSLPMDQWDPWLWRSWWSANKYFRRTRAFGLLYDPIGYIWDDTSINGRKKIINDLDLNEKIKRKKWRSKTNGLDKTEREKIKEYLEDKEKFDIKKIKWIGEFFYKTKARISFFIDLIQADKSAFGNFRSGSQVPISGSLDPP